MSKEKKKSPIKDIRPLNKAEVSHFYGRPAVASAMVEFARKREIAGRAESGAYGSRPSIINYPTDIEEMVASGIVSLHASVERWQNPMRISTGMKRSELDELRVGWDLILDIDCEFLEYSKIAARLLCEEISAWGIQNIGVKFSGRSGFHIIVPFESFPKRFDRREMKNMFPDAPRKIAAYLKDAIEDALGSEILALEGSAAAFAEKIGKPVADVAGKTAAAEGIIDPYTALSIDTLLISSRHLFRMPYSLHERSWLASLPLSIEEIPSFDPESTRPENILKVAPFLTIDHKRAGEAKSLLDRAYSYALELEEKNERSEMGAHRKKREKGDWDGKENEILTIPLPETAFPPCINNILSGLEDGRKRAEFILRTFLRRGGWAWEDIGKFLMEWNKKNPEPLGEGKLLAGVAWQKRQKNVLMPPNCDAPDYYKDLKVCTPGPKCLGAKNPFNVAMRILLGKRKTNERGKEKKPRKKKVVATSNEGIELVEDRI